MKNKLLNQAPVYKLHARLFNTRQLLRRVISQAGYLPGLRLLDIGCGPGEAAEFVEPGDYVGIDISESYINYARQNQQGTFYALPADAVGQLPGPFDLAIVLGVFHHMPDDEVRTTLAGLANIMRPQGRFVVLEAVWPTHWWDFPGYLLRKLDRGNYIRTGPEWVKLLGETWQIHDARITRNYVIEYFECVLTHG